MAGQVPSTTVAGGDSSIRGTDMTDQCVRLGMAIVIIALISLGLYQFSGRAGAFEPSLHGMTFRQ